MSEIACPDCSEPDEEYVDEYSCETCIGRRVVDCEECNEGFNWVVCGDCDGSGESSDGFNNCAKCKGDGEVAEVCECQL